MAPPSDTTSHASHLSKPEFYGVAWTFTAIAILLSVGRFWIRKSTFGKLQSDDWIHLFAITTLIPYMAVYTSLFPLTLKVGLYGVKAGPKPTVAELEAFYRYEVVGQFLFWTVLYAVKFVFLMLFHHIFRLDKTFMHWWWGIFVYTWIAFWACFFTPLWICGTPGDLWNLKKCLLPYASGVINNFAEVGLALNISSDLAIMILPVCFLRNLQMTLSKKIGVASLFCVGLIVIIIDAVRLATGDGGGVVSQSSLFNALEPTIAVIIACFPTYRSLFTVGGLASRKNKSSGRYYRSSEGSGAVGIASQDNRWNRSTRRAMNEGYEMSPSEHSPAPPAPAHQAWSEERREIGGYSAV